MTKKEDGKLVTTLGMLCYAPLVFAALLAGYALHDADSTRLDIDVTEEIEAEKPQPQKAGWTSSD